MGAFPEPGYRPCVGMMLLNNQGLVWLGRRSEKIHDEGQGTWWQMPQGGIDEGEEPRACAIRELHEETSVRSAELIGEAPEWYHYDLPRHLQGKSWGGRWRGQTQKWFAFRFTGEDSEIDLKPPGHQQEFELWQWIQIDAMKDLVVPFKRQVYGQVIAAFRHLAR